MEAQVTEHGARLVLPCGHTVTFTAGEITAGLAVERACECRTRLLVPVPNTILAALGDSRNKPGTLLVLDVTSTA
jgi:hypothetical protein